jgi:hypothetical protein
VTIIHLVQALLSSDKIDQAFSLLDMSQLKPERKEYLFRRIHRKAVFLRMAELDLASCKQSILFSNIDIREVRSHRVICQLRC